MLIFSDTFLASSLYKFTAFSILYFTFDNGLEIRTEILRLFILCEFLLIYFLHLSAGKGFKEGITSPPNLTSPSYIHLVTVYAWCLYNFPLSFKQETEATSQLSLTVILSMIPLHLSFNLHLKVFFGSVFLVRYFSHLWRLNNVSAIAEEFILTVTYEVSRGVARYVFVVYLLFSTQI